jgi:hypothetical protein
MINTMSCLHALDAKREFGNKMPEKPACEEGSTATGDG